MHLLYLIDEIALRGGTEKSLFSLAVAMGERGHKVTVFSLSAGPYADTYRSEQLLEYSCLQVRRIYGLSGIKRICFLKRYIDEKAVDIVQTTHTGSDLIGPVAARLALHKVVVISSRRDLGFTKSNRHIYMQKYVNRWVDGILANSRAVKESVVNSEGYPAEKIKIINNGIVFDLFEHLNRTKCKRKLAQRFGLQENDIFIGTAGNLNPIKGQKYLLEAMVKVSQLYPNSYCFLAGEGDEVNNLKEFCSEKGIINRVFFLGNISTIPEFLAGLDIYVQPSLSEGFSNSILEAMAAGCPVVATDVGGNPDAIIDLENGFIVPAADSYEISRKIIFLIQKKDFALSIGRLNKERITQKFSFEKMISCFERYYLNFLIY